MEDLLSHVGQSMHASQQPLVGRLKQTRIRAGLELARSSKPTNLPKPKIHCNGASM